MFLLGYFCIRGPRLLYAYRSLPRNVPVLDVSISHDARTPGLYNEKCASWATFSTEDYRWNSNSHAKCPVSARMPARVTDSLPTNSAQAGYKCRHNYTRTQQWLHAEHWVARTLSRSVQAGYVLEKATYVAPCEILCI